MISTNIIVCSAGEGGEGLRRSDVVSWYLEQVADQIDTEEELVERKALVEKVIDRLTYHVSCACWGDLAGSACLMDSPFPSLSSISEINRQY